MYGLKVLGKLGGAGGDRGDEVSRVSFLRSFVFR